MWDQLQVPPCIEWVEVKKKYFTHPIPLVFLLVWEDELKYQAYFRFVFMLKNNCQSINNEEFAVFSQNTDIKKGSKNTQGENFTDNWTLNQEHFKDSYYS